MQKSELQIKPIDIKRFVLHRSPLIIAMGIFLFALFAPLLMTQVSPVYRTQTYLMITPGKEPTIQGRERDTVPGELRDYMRTLSNRITSYNILLGALENLPKEEWPDFLKPGAAPASNVFRLMSKLDAEEVFGTYLLSVSIEAGSSKGLGSMLNSITETFLGQLEKEQESQFARRLEYLSEERLRIMKNVQDKRDELVLLADEAGQHSFLHKTYDAHLEQLRLLQRAYWSAESTRVENQRNLDTIQFENKSLATLSLDPEAKTRVDDNFGINRMEQWTYESLQELRSTIDGLTPENLERQYVEQRMDAMESYLGEYRGIVHSNTLSTLNEQRQLDMNENLFEAQAATDAAEKAADYLFRQKELAEEGASHISYVIFKAQQLTYNIEQLQSRLVALESRMDDTQLQAKAPLPMHVDRKAQSPEVPYESNQAKLLLFAFVLSFGFVGAACFLFDLLDNRVRSRHDVERLLRGTVPDPIPLEEELMGNLPHALRYPALKEVADAYRKLSIRIYPEKKEEGAKIFCMTGSSHEVGTTTLAVNLAECLSVLGSRSLLIELDLAHPSRFWSDADRAPIGHDVVLAESIVHDAVRGIDVLPAVCFVENPMPATRLEELLEKLRNTYDWILLDCAPITIDDTAQLAAQQSDAVILVAMEDLSYYSHLSAAKNLIEYFKVPAMTIVLNGARRTPGAWLFTAVQSTLGLITIVHRKLQIGQQRLLRFRSPNKTDEK